MIMNKKVSTIFAMAALMGGVFCSSAYAETIDAYLGSEATKVESKPYFLKVGNSYLGSDFTGPEKAAVKYFTLAEGNNDDQLTKETLERYLWTVSPVQQGGQKTAYTFTNELTGEQIKFKIESDAPTTIITEVGDESTAEPLFYVAADVTDTDTKAEKEYKGGAALFKLVGYDVTNIQLSFPADDAATVETAVDGDLVLTAAGETIQLVNVADGITITDPSELNDLYNSAGFNFQLTNSNLSGVQNIFASKRIKAIYVHVPGVWGTEENADKYFPAGVYFITAGYVSNPQNANNYDQLVNCTFIAVDSDNNIADDADQQKAGLGFTLTEVSGKDLILYNGYDEKQKASGDQIAVQNAAFTVRESATSNGVYDLQVKARYVEASGSDTQKEATVSISAVKGDAALKTVTKGNNFIFKFSESSAVKPSTLLFKGDTASIYNIRLYVANGADDTRNGKYLTTTPSKEFIAKGAVLADTETPAYQWVISAVDGSNITFTNRETGATLTTQLFDEGNGIYSVAEDIDAVGYPNTYTFYNVNEKGDVVKGNENSRETFPFDYNTKIQLEPVAAATYAGYLNVEDKSLMTLSFGRDIAPTSNKVYPFVEVGEDRLGNPTYTLTQRAGALTSNIADAAQWLLVKNPKGVTQVKYNYVYANGNLINTKNNGDVVYANTYAFQLVLDGKVIEDEYLNITGGTLTTTPNYYFIQENVDGSVNVMTSHAGASALTVLYYQQEKNPIDSYVDNSYLTYATIETGTNAKWLKTYLIAEAPAVSLPAVEGHYSFVSEYGNYITMNEERDGLTVKEESEPMYLYVTDEEEVVPSFYVTKGVSPVEGQRMYLFNPIDSVKYYVATGDYKKNYEWADDVTKAIFKSAAISESRDTLTTEIKGESTLVAQEASNAEKVEGGLDMFKMQIIEDPESDGLYVVRNVATMDYLYSWNGMLAWGDKDAAMKFDITGAAAPTANEGVSATEVKVIATDGAINIKNAAGKNVVISTILGQQTKSSLLTTLQSAYRLVSQL